jgi:hypothetical protein
LQTLISCSSLELYYQSPHGLVKAYVQHDQNFQSSEDVSAITFTGKLDMTYKFFIGKIFSEKVTS